MGWMDQPLAEPETPQAPTGAAENPPSVVRLSQVPVVQDAPPPSRPMWDTKDVAASTVSGVTRGAAGLADTVLTGGRPDPRALEMEPIPEGVDLSTYTPKFANPEMWANGSAQPLTPVSDAAREAAPNAMAYEPKSVAGGYGQTLGEFASGMLFPAGKGGMLERALYNVIAPAVTSETAGNIARALKPEDEATEAWARLAGAFAGGPLASALEGGYRAIRNPKVVDPHIATLDRAGVTTTAGNVARDPQLLAREAAAPRTAEIIANQPVQFRDAALTAIGAAIPDDTKTITDVLEAARKQAGGTYARVTQGLTMVPSRLHATKMRDIANTYATGVETGLQTGTVKQIQTAIENSFKTGIPIPPDQIGKWRSAVSAATRSASPVARQSAIETLKVLDDVIGRSLAQAGRTDDIALLGQARAQYRDVLAFEGALLKSGKLGDDGLITPNALVSSLSNQGKEAFMRGRRGELADLARAGRARLTPVDKIPPVKQTLLGKGARLAADAAGTLAGYEAGKYLFPDSMFGQYVSSLVGAGVSEGLQGGLRGLSNSALSSRVMQEALKRAAQNPSSGASGLAGGVIGGLTGSAGPQADGGRVERKSGGRVGVNHDSLADQLVGAAERAKKGISKETEPLLGMHDDHIAHALELANRSI